MAYTIVVEDPDMHLLCPYCDAAIEYVRIRYEADLRVKCDECYENFDLSITLEQ